MDLKTLEIAFDKLEDTDKGILAPSNILGNLRDAGVILIARRSEKGCALIKVHQLRRMSLLPGRIAAMCSI